MSILTAPSMRVPEQARQIVSDSQEGFAGGQNPKAATNVAPLDQCAAITNMRVIRDGELAKRPGLLSVGSVRAGQLLYPWWSASQAESVGTSGGSIGAFSNTNGTITPQSMRFGYTVTTNAPALTAVADISLFSGGSPTSVYCATFRDGTGDCLYTGVVASGMVKWKGSTTVSTAIAAATAPGMGPLWVYNQRLFGCTGGWYAAFNGVQARTSTLYWSGLNNGDTLGDTANGGGFATIRTYGVTPRIVGGMAVGGSMYILHENAVSVFTGTTFDDINISAGAQGVSPNIGFPLAWNVIDQVGYIVTPEGLFLLTSKSLQPAGSVESPDPIANAMLAYPMTDNAQAFNTRPWYILDNARRQEIWIIGSFPDASSALLPSRLFIYNTRLGRFTGSGTFNIVIDYATVVPTDYLIGTDMLFVSGTAVYGCDFLFDGVQVYQDNGVSYTSSVQCRRMYTGAPYDLKAFRMASVQMGSGAGVTPATVGSATGAKLSYVTSSGSVSDTTDMTAQSVNKIQLSGQGDWIDLTITDAGASSTGWSVGRAAVDGVSYGRRGG